MIFQLKSKMANGLLIFLTLYLEDEVSIYYITQENLREGDINRW